MVIFCAIFAIIFLILAMALFVTSGVDENIGEFFMGLFFLALFLLAFYGMGFFANIGYSTDITQLKLNSVVNVVWSAPSQLNNNRFLTVAITPNGNYRLFTLNRQPPNGWVKVTSDERGNKILIPFPLEPEAE